MAGEAYAKTGKGVCEVWKVWKVYRGFLAEPSAISGQRAADKGD
jgi:hypothetical protein